MKTLLTFLLSLFKPKPTPMRIIIGADPNYKVQGTNTIWDFFHDPEPPDDWVHTLQEYRLLPKGYVIPCLTDKLVYDMVLQELRIKVGANPKIKYWSVSIPDSDKWCQCLTCQRYNKSDILILFVNRIARQFPDKIISTCLPSSVSTFLFSFL